jgi:hypothetical protein
VDGQAETDSILETAQMGLEAAAIRRSRRYVDVAAASADPAVVRRAAGRVFQTRVSGVGGTEPIHAEFIGVSVDVEKPPRVGPFQADGVRLRFGVGRAPCVVRQPRNVVTKAPSGHRSRATSVFPLGFGGQLIDLSLSMAQASAKVDGIVPGEIPHRSIRILGFERRVRSHDGQVLGLRQLGLPEVERPGDPDPVGRLLARVPGVVSHHELAGRDQRQFHADRVGEHCRDPHILRPACLVLFRSLLAEWT